MGWTPRPFEPRRSDDRAALERAKRLRTQANTSEARCWRLLRMINREGANFRRQAHVGGLVFDFADLRAKLLVELDGGVHNLPSVQLRDQEKSQRANTLGFTVLRITNAEVWTAPDATLDRVRAALATAPSPQRGEGREGGRTSKRNALRDNRRSPERPLPLPPPHGEGD